MNAPHQRDEGLRRVSRLTGWLAAAGIVGVGAFAGLLARPTTSSAKTTGTDSVGTTAGQSTNGVQNPATSSSGSKAKSGSAKSSAPKVSRPSQAPVPSRQRGPAVSGGS